MLLFAIAAFGELAVGIRLPQGWYSDVNISWGAAATAAASDEGEDSTKLDDKEQTTTKQQLEQTHNMRFDDRLLVVTVFALFGHVT